MKDFLQKARKLAYSEFEKTGMPVKQHIDLSCRVGERLAEELGADTEIVEAGTLLMDCMIGTAYQQGKLEDHVQMSLDKTNEILAEFSLAEEAKENIRHCVQQHHGVEEFYSPESEICCNADCYRFASVEGFLYSVRYLRDMPFEKLIQLLSKKADEKWNALSLDICKQELESEYKLVKKMLRKLNSDKE